MDLVATLAAGVKGAESGRAELYVRGTSTRASWYEDAEGTSQISTGANIALDTNGGATVYVNQYVDVFVYDSGGTLVRSFTQMHTATATEVINAAFTGTSYADASTGVSKPATIDELLTRWKTNNGSPDWKVLIGTTDTTIRTALGPTTEMWFNVKDPTYGATGDGVANDTTEIQAAIDAANTAGGGIVYFPEGTYLISAVLDKKGTVSLKGAGRGVTIITSSNAAAAGMVTFEDSASQECFIEDLEFVQSVTGGGTILKALGAGKVDIRRCKIGNSNTLDHVSANAVSASLSIIDCEFPTWRAATGDVISATTNTGRTTVRGCTFKAPTAWALSSIINGVGIDVEGCLFDLTASTGAAGDVYSSSSTTLDGSVKNCIFTDSGGSSIDGIALFSYIAGSVFVESGNVFPIDDSNGFTAYDYTPSSSVTVTGVRLESRETRAEVITGNDATVTYKMQQYGSTLVERTGTAACSLDPDGAPPSGGTHTLIVRNTSGSATGNLDYTNALFEPALSAAAALSNGNVDIVHSVSGVDSAATTDLVYVLLERRDA